MSELTVHSGNVVNALRTLMVENALPLWAGEGWDAVRGGFVDRLHSDGSADQEAPRRLLVQARQIYCFAKAAQLGWYPAGRDVALNGLEHMLARAKSPDGKPGFVTSFAADGHVISANRDTYDHAFVLLALATVYQLDHDSQVRAEIASVLEFLDHNLKSEHGGYREGKPTTLPRRQNPHMHLFEATIALFDATYDASFQNRAGEIFGLFVTHFYDSNMQALVEYFEDDWSRILPATIEPGHQAEWVWLLKGFERITGCPTAKYRAALLASAMRYRDERTGCLVDEGGVDGRITKPSGRCWPQTEIAKAWMAQAESGDNGAAEEARLALVRLERYYLSHPVKGGWYDRFDHDNSVEMAPILASSFYHVLCAIAEADRSLR
ncbi:AGE family epimerase/isomerase [Nitrobacteraceae bacterium UC4446_H13]